MPIFQLEGETPSVSLYAGGWTRDAAPRDGWAVIDLTGDKDPRDTKVKALNSSGKEAFGGVLRMSGKNKSGPWLSMPIKDYGVPSWERPVWDALAIDVARLLTLGTPVMVLCTGGHGRTGLAVCILAGILRPDLVGTNPIKWLREKYCEEVVETKAQVDYVFEILGLPNDGKTKGASSYTTGGYNSGAYGSGYSGYSAGDKWDNVKKAWTRAVQPTGSAVGPSKDTDEPRLSSYGAWTDRDGKEVDSPKVVAPHSAENTTRGGSMTASMEDEFMDNLTETRLEALNRLSEQSAGFWEDDDGKVVDVNTGEKFTWAEIELFTELQGVEISEPEEDNLWTEWERSCDNAQVL